MLNTSAGSGAQGLSIRKGVLRSRPHPTLIGTLLRAGRVREAINIGEATLARGTATRDECEVLAKAYWALGMGRSAERLAKGLCKQSAPSIEALVLLGEIYQERMWASQLQSILRQLATLARRHPKIRTFSQALETLGIESNPPEGDDTGSQLRRAEWYLRRGWVGEAEGLLKKILQNHPDDEKGKALMWGCVRERKLEARFGPLGNLDMGENTGQKPVESAEEAANAGDEAVDPAQFASMIQQVEVVEAAASDEADDDEDYDDDDYDVDDDDDWGDEDFDDLDDDEDESEVSIGFARRVHLSIAAKQQGPSPIQDRMTDEVIVIERGDQPRIIAPSQNSKGIWFRGSQDLIQDSIPWSGGGNKQHAEADSSLGVTVNPSKDRDDMSAKRDDNKGRASSTYLKVGRYGFDEDDEDAKATEVVPHFSPAQMKVVQLGGGAQPSAAEEWEEGPTQAVEEAALMDAFLDDDDPKTRIVNADEDDDDPATRIVQNPGWEGDVATRIAGLDEMDNAKVAGPTESTKVLNKRAPAQQLAGDRTVAIGPDATKGAGKGKADDKPLYVSTTQRAAGAPGAYATTPLAVPHEPSYLASPALLISILVFGAVAFSFFTWQNNQRQALLDEVGSQVEMLLLTGDSSSVNDAARVVSEALEGQKEPDPALEAMAARVAWAQWAETGGATQLGPVQATLDALALQLEGNRDLLLAQGYRDLATGDITQGAIRLEEALQVLPEDALLGALLVEMTLESEADDRFAKAGNLLEKVKGWAEAAPADTNSDPAVKALVDARLAYAEILVAVGTGDRAGAQASLEKLIQLNPAHPLVEAYRAYLALPENLSDDEALVQLEAAYAAMAPSASPRARAQLLAWQMDYAERSGALEKAVGFADRLMAADPSWPEGLWRSAKAQVYRGDHILARQRATQAVEFAPNHVQILEDQVFLLLDHQQSGAAEVLLSNVPRALESKAPVLRAKALTALARRDLTKAEAFLKEAKVKAPNDLKTLNLEAKVGALLEGARAGNPPLEAILKGPETLAMDLSRGRIYARQSVLASGSSASKLAKKALKASPKDPVVREILAEGYERTGDRAKAVKTLEKSVEMAPNRVTTLALLAKYHALDGKKDEALGYWEQAASHCTEGALCNEAATLLK